MKAEGQKASPQKVTHGRKIRDGEVVRVHTPPPHQTDDEVGSIEEDGDLEEDENDHQSVCHHLLYMTYNSNSNIHVPATKQQIGSR